MNGKFYNLITYQVRDWDGQTDQLVDFYDGRFDDPVMTSTVAATSGLMDMLDKDPMNAVTIYVTDDVSEVV